MIIVISPAKKLDMAQEPQLFPRATKPLFLDQSSQLVSDLKSFKVKDFVSLMGVSKNIASLNVDRYQEWAVPFNKQNAKAAILSFKGDVYQGMDVKSFEKDDFEFAQKHLRILSGLYGCLRPLDLMQAYRLEMGIALKNEKGTNLYQFWKEGVTKYIKKDLAKQKSDFLINLASNEYFKVIDKKGLEVDVITPVFKDYKNGQYKVISFLAKKARGMMCAHIIKNKIETVEGIKQFKSDGYRFDKALSAGGELVFTRKR